ncbi:hypothetical protein FDP41_007301 [Naegleria fowleri]|uniref:Nudix hydrolase domain-containing protein n=1 Tax=Naegleria fowleri TaxID=5763 RepID=A0A6A5BIN0_NAEFO|nr:uncharacterized protein FDP41_007301 [Naegleria fowleri]KAF0973914.1 hypothetical protein FDP41_007301 [Naegleria fowleri]
MSEQQQQQVRSHSTTTTRPTTTTTMLSESQITSDASSVVVVRSDEKTHKKIYCQKCAHEMQQVQEEGLSSNKNNNNRTKISRMKCLSCGFILYNNPVPVVAAIVEWKDHEHLVLIQNKTWPSHWYGLVSGFVECKEDPLDAVKREVQEELGLQQVIVTPQDLIGVYNFAFKNEIIIVYHVQVCEDSNEEIRIDTNELSDYQMVRIDKVRPWKAGTGYGLRDWLLKKGFTENANSFIDPFQKKESVVDTPSKL